jgi:hypothetical protein
MPPELKHGRLKIDRFGYPQATFFQKPCKCPIDRANVLLLCFRSSVGCVLSGA